MHLRAIVEISIEAIYLNFSQIVNYFLQASIEIYKYKAHGLSADYNSKLRRKRLFSFVIYCYAMEILLFPRFCMLSRICLINLSIAR